jgi:hypothetical protein
VCKTIPLNYVGGEVGIATMAAYVTKVKKECTKYMQAKRERQRAEWSVLGST